MFDRGARQFKFVDRTFNLNLRTSRAILEFFLERYEPGLFLHFEMIPDRFPESLRGIIQQFPAGALQFEVGVQTFNDDVAELISRRQDNAKLEDNLRFLRDQTGVHVHADLIVGLPGETAESFAAGFDRLVALGPQEIQVGMLKRLRGTPIVRHDAAWQMVYAPAAPYEIVSTRCIDGETMAALRHFCPVLGSRREQWKLCRDRPTFVGGQDRRLTAFVPSRDGVRRASSEAGAFRSENWPKPSFSISSTFAAASRRRRPRRFGATTSAADVWTAPHFYGRLSRLHRGRLRSFLPRHRLANGGTSGPRVADRCHESERKKKAHAARGPVHSSRTRIRYLSLCLSPIGNEAEYLPKRFRTS